MLSKEPWDGYSLLTSSVKNQQLKPCIFNPSRNQIFKKFKPVKGKRAVKKMKDGTHRTYPLGRGAYRLWDSSRGLKKIMQLETKDDGNNCISVEMLNSDSEDFIGVHKTANEDFLKQFSLRKRKEFIFELFE